MSFSTPREQASGEAARFSAGQASQLANLALPEIQQVLARLGSDITFDKQGNLGIPKSVQEQFGKLSTNLDQSYERAGAGENAYIQQAFKQSGNPYSAGQLDSTLMAAGRGLEQSRQTAQRNLQYQEAVAGLGQYNNLMQLMGQGSGAALNLAGGFGGANSQAIGMLSNQNPWQGALGGGLSGAATGASFGPYGALAGLAVGGALGYFGSGG